MSRQGTFVVAVVIAVLGYAAAWGRADAGRATVFHVSVGGSDTGPGTEGKPFATLGRARQAVRRKIAAGLTGDVTVVVAAGVYELAEPLVFGPADSGTRQHAVSYVAADNEKAVVSGGRRITGWKRAKGKLWTADVGDVKAGRWHFRQLFVDGRRARRARTPNADDKTSYLQLTGASLAADLKTYQLRLPPKHVRDWRNIRDVEIVIHGNWAINRKRLQQADAKTGTITLAPPHAKAIPWNRPDKGKFCYLENAAEMLDRPGEWYLNRPTGVLTYWPREGEDMAKAHVVAPVLGRLVEIVGGVGAPVRNLHFRGIRFEHTAWPLPAEGYHGIQACHYTAAGPRPPGRRWRGIEPAIFCEYVEGVSFTDGAIAHIGGSGVYFSKWARDCRIVGNHVYDVAANGVMLAGPNDKDLVPKGNRISNNHVHATGVEYFGACAIWVGFAQGTTITHNLVHDTPYTGISVGWQWDPRPTACKENLIEANHVHDVMKTLADGGCIYTLGYQPGTVLRGNLLHDVRRGAHTHGGAPNNGIFIDEGSKGFLFERNVIYNTHGRPLRFNQCRREWHTWKDNVLGGSSPAPEKVSAAKRVRAQTVASAGLEARYRKRLLGRQAN
ncbi:MAG: right-handed parallel beta-helix repeat-containing protein [Phycisphaerae bacterium]|nr:right-handed parallel beta-helix repeat-containing protein [Phycisphaerae bacterium]